MYYKIIDSILGKITILCDDKALLALWIEGQSLGEQYNLNLFKRIDTPIIKKTEDWLERYFHQEKPSINELPIHLEGTSFQLEVWHILCQIPYGKTTTYKNIALEVAKKMNKQKMSAQAVGNAVGKNPISIIIPCHRVIGTNGKMVGYNGGISIKEKLLQLEQE